MPLKSRKLAAFRIFKNRLIDDVTHTANLSDGSKVALILGNEEQVPWAQITEQPLRDRLPVARQLMNSVIPYDVYLIIWMGCYGG